MRRIFFLSAAVAFGALNAAGSDINNVDENNFGEIETSGENLNKKRTNNNDNNKVNRKIVLPKLGLYEQKEDNKKDELDDSKSAKELVLSGAKIGDDKISLLLHSKGLGKLLENIEVLFLSNNGIDTDGFILIIQWLKIKSKSIKILDLSNNNIGEVSRFGLGSMRWNSSIQELNLSKNKFKTRFVAQLGKALEGNESIIKLNLSNNKIKVNIEELFKSLETTFIADLILVNCGLNDSAIAVVGNHIKNIRDLKLLDLSLNKITDEGLNDTQFTYSFYGSNFDKKTSGLSRDLKGVWKLKKLLLNGNKITEEGWEKFVDSVKPWYFQTDHEVTFYETGSDGTVLH